MLRGAGMDIPGAVIARTLAAVWAAAPLRGVRDRGRRAACARAEDRPCAEEWESAPAGAFVCRKDLELAPIASKEGTVGPIGRGGAGIRKAGASCLLSLW